MLLPALVALPLLLRRGRIGTLVVALIVTQVLLATFLAIILGTIRGALVVVLGIFSSMAIALFGMHLFGVTGDLMSLGAIDFGFLVDGPIVILEGVMAGTAGKSLVKRAREQAYGEIAAALARPVSFPAVLAPSSQVWSLPRPCAFMRPFTDWVHA